MSTNIKTMEPIKYDNWTAENHITAIEKYIYD